MLKTKRMVSVLILLAGLAVGHTLQAQTPVSSEEVAAMYRTVSKKRISVHDPSVVYDSATGSYYIFGSHKAGAYTTDMQNWTTANPTWAAAGGGTASNAEAFVTPQVTKVKKGGEEVDFPAFNAMEWSKRTDDAYDINGNMWAPDVVWNPTMNKWCYYLSINGDKWHSSIILLTADNITGPYRYQGPVVICGFDDADHSYKGTDLELVLGTQTSLPARYDVGDKWGNRWPHTIDPAVFYDEEGKLWMVYGSWSGGIWMLELDETTGLRDYDVTYPSVGGSTDGVTSDPYYGTKVGGGYYVSGEGPYIEHIGNYYYMFVSYGFYNPDGGYEMRVFRSDRPNGPYKDSRGVSAIFNGYVMNYGTNGDKRGEKLMGPYNRWGSMKVGECAQGHNSIIAAPDDRTYLVYHTKFNNNTYFHEVRTHQVFVNKDGWLVASPFEYNGEQTTSTDIAAKAFFTAEEMAGGYQLVVHTYNMDYANRQENTPCNVVLHDDGTVTGDKTGTWTMDTQASYITIKLDGNIYTGVAVPAVMDGYDIPVITFTASCTATGENIWGYKMDARCELAWQINNQKSPVTDGMNINRHVPLMDIGCGMPNVTIEWTSENPEVVSQTGRYDPTSLQEDLPLTLGVRISTPGYYWQKDWLVTALSATHATPQCNWSGGMVAHYGFDDELLGNSLNTAECATTGKNGTAALPILVEAGGFRQGNAVHLSFGASGNESYVSIPNALKGYTLSQGATLSFWVNRGDDNLWDAFFAFVSGNSRFYMTGNAYLGYNDGNASGVNNWIDLNHPGAVKTQLLGVGEWHLVTLTLTAEHLRLYVDGSEAALMACNGMLNNTAVGSAEAFDYSLIVSLLQEADELCLGKGSFWGSPDCCMDDVVLYARALSTEEVQGLEQMENRVFDFSSLATGITAVQHSLPRKNVVYDLCGRRLSSLASPAGKGIYILNGKKVVVK
ncbi:MAG: family 43 glycosylhydrolase [Prevotella sp.]